MGGGKHVYLLLLSQSDWSIWARGEAKHIYLLLVLPDLNPTSRIDMVGSAVPIGGKIAK
jgi:hypothetical protein